MRIGIGIGFRPDDDWDVWGIAIGAAAMVAPALPAVTQASTSTLMQGAAAMAAPALLAVTQASAAAPFVPWHLPNCIVAYRSDLGITLNGADVSQWNDQSGNARNATQAVPVQQPAYGAASGVNSTPGLTFALAEVMDMAMAPAPTSHTYDVWAALNPQTTIPIQALIGFDSGGGAGSGEISTCDNTGKVGLYDGSDWRHTGEDATGDQYLRWRIDAPSTTLECYRNGTSIGSTATYDGTLGGTWTSTALGSLLPAPAQALNAIVSEMTLFDVAPSANAVALLDWYYQTRYGLP